MSEDDKMITTDNSLRDAHEELVRRGDKLLHHTLLTGLLGFGE
jgi:hypothetical protein